MNSLIDFTGVGPQFVVQDVNASINFYKKVLGFEVDYEKGSPVEYAVVYSGDVYIHLCLQKNQKYKIGPGCCFICASNIENLWEEVKVSQTEVVQILQKNDYGQEVVFNDFIIKDLDGNTLRIGQELNNKS